MATLVIGGGWSGIAAAMGLAMRGCEVVLVEERPYLGGRARSFVDRQSGDEIDNGQHVMMGCYHDLLRVVRELGTEHILERQKALTVAFVDPSGIHDVLDASRLPGKAGIAVGMLMLRGIGLRSRLAGLRLALRISLGSVTGKGMSCAEFLAQQSQPDDIIRRFWEPIVLATLNAPLEKASASLLVEVMRLAFLGSTTDAQLLIPTAGLSALLEPFPRWMQENNGRIMTSTSVDRLVVSDGEIRSAELSNGTSLSVDAVISAVPQRALSRLLATSELPDDLPPPPEMSPIISVYLWYDKPWMPYDFAAALGTTVQWVFDKRRTRNGLVALTVSAGHGIVAEPSEDIISLCDKELRLLFPELSSILLINGVVIKEKWATPLFTPLDDEKRVECGTPSARNLFLAGDWTRTGLPATLEGAVRSGFTASDAVLKQGTGIRLPHR
ncbi:MAG: FAD-dependent oxidoreductase [Ignavibacteria bacterium]|nr:FAD-dependent oxidoreductase [Ignavibacteria bacterium]